MDKTLLSLLLGTIIYRPYVYIFFACYLVFALYHLGLKRTVLFTFLSYLVAFAAEFSSTRNGFPFGLYTYIDTTRTRELWISNVPFWDSLSFVFLSYFSFVVAGAALARGDVACGMKRPWAPVLGGFLMMLLDVVIDPVALRGSRWFLGQVYFYPNGGAYFGVTISNFIGWWFVGTFTQWSFRRLAGTTSMRPLHRLFLPGALAVYTGVFAFNLFMTYWIGEYGLAMVSTLVSAGTLLVIVRFCQPLRKTL